MRALRVVGITGTDGDITVVLEDPERHERYTVPADETLRAAARGDLTRLGQIAIEVGNELRPREIQARIRAGASVAELAALAGVPEQKIERFAYPVLLERSRTAELARHAHPVRADGPDPRTLGEVVADTFNLRGQDYDDAAWDSWRGEDGKWVVTLAWTAGRSDNRAHWTFQPGASGGTVTALDEHASDLVEGLPARPLRTIGEVIDLARGEEPVAEAVAEAPRRAEPRAEVAPRRFEPRRAEPADNRRAERAAHRAGPDRAEPDRSASHRSEPDRSGSDRTERSVRHRTDPHRAEPAAERGPEPARPEPRRPEPTRTEPSGTDRAGSDRTASDRTRPDRTEPAAEHRDPQPATGARPDRPEPAGARPAESRPAAGSPAPPAEEPPPAAPRRTKKGKPVMPSWDEVLLGVKGQR